MEVLYRAVFFQELCITAAFAYWCSTRIQNLPAALLDDNDSLASNDETNDPESVSRLNGGESMKYSQTATSDIRRAEPLITNRER